MMVSFDWGDLLLKKGEEGGEDKVCKEIDFDLRILI